MRFQGRFSLVDFRVSERSQDPEGTRWLGLDDSVALIRTILPFLDVIGSTGVTYGTGLLIYSLFYARLR